MITNKDKKILKALGNSAIKYNIGKDAISDELLDVLAKALKAHELIKLVFNKVVAKDKDNLTKEIIEKLDAEFVFSIGHTCLIYKENKQKKDYIKLPH